MLSPPYRMEGDAITLQKLFEYHVERVESDRTVVGRLLPTGLRPTFLAKFTRHGIELPADMFGTAIDAAFGANLHHNGWNGSENGQ